MNSRASISPWRLSLPATLLLAFLVVAGATLPGCGGCKREDPIAKKKREEEEKKKEEERRRKRKAEEPKPNFESAIQVLPNYEIVEKDPNKEEEQKLDEEEDDPASRQSAYTYVKPGHWAQAIHKMKANNFDFPGVLRISAIDAQRRPLDIERTNYRFVSFRPAVLPKGQSKQIDTLFFLPRREQIHRGAYNINSDLLSARGGGTQQHQAFRLGTTLDEHQYFIVVLASNNSSYVYMNSLPSVVVTDSTIAELGGLRYYRVILPKIDRSVPIPSNLQSWTSIAYLLWDDIDPALLTPEQRTAAIDWLHWGGQIIISGPNSLDKLRGSFLAPYLPAQAGPVRKLAQADVDELSNHWSLPSKKKGENRHIQILPDKPMAGIELKMHEDAKFVPHTGNLVAERRVGGGRIVVTAFPLTDLRIRYWKNFDGFFNAVLLRRPGREFGQSSDLSTLEMKWASPTLSPFIRDPRLSTTLRLFTRDIGYLTGQVLPAAAQAPPIMQQDYPEAMGFGPRPERQPTFQYTSLEHPDIDDWHFTGYQAQPSSGVGGWNDFSGAADAARDSLDESAKIEIPKAQFVLQVLAVYLLVLVPLNWLVFWLLGRVEWSWAAAPVIAIVGAVCVIRLAQLNIGFVRSRTEIAVLELQRDYPRGHLTRYTTLYTSLSTAYQLSFDEPTAVALPFVVDEGFERKPNEWPQVAELHRDKETHLTGVQVNSNSTEKVHSEQMLVLQGPISLVAESAGGLRLKNSSELTLRDVGVIRRPEGTSRTDFEVAYVAELGPQTMVSLSFARYVPAVEQQGDRGPAGYRAPWIPQWDKSLVMSAKPAAGEADKGIVRLHRLVNLTVNRLRLVPGDVRLIAWSSDELPGMRVSPRPAQTTTQTLVLAHLTRGPLPEPQRDTNVSDDFKVIDPLEETEPLPGETPATDATQSSLPGSGLRVQNP